MKNLIITIIFTFISNLIVGQDFKLVEPNISILKSQTKTEHNKEVIYLYLINNYKPISEKYDLKYYEWGESTLCSFKEEFSNGINYSIFQCKEAGGISVELELPKIKRLEIMNWIEKIYEVDKINVDQNIWKENNTKFEPKEINPGCYYRVEDREFHTVVHLYCGC